MWVWPYLFMYWTLKGNIASCVILSQMGKLSQEEAFLYVDIRHKKLLMKTRLY